VNTLGGLLIVIPLLGAPEVLRAMPSDTATDPSALEVRVVGQRPLAKDRTQDATTVAGERLRESPRPSVFEALSPEAADVYVTSRGGGIHGVANGATGAIHIRGLGGSPNSQVLVVEDGVPDYQGIFGHPLPDEFFPFLIDQVMVLKGGDSVLYGTNALGGVILIRDRWRDQPGYELASDSAVGSFGTVQETVGTLGQTGPWDFRGAVHAMKTDGHRAGAGGADLVGQFGVRYRVSRPLEVTLREKALHVTGSDPGPASHPYPNHWFDVWRERLSLEVGLAEGPLRISLIPYVNLGRHELYDGFYSLDYTAGGSLESAYRLHRDAELRVGVATEWVDGKVDNRLSGAPTPVRGLGSYSLYHQLTVRPVKPLSVVFGMRDVYSTAYGLVVVSKAGVHYHLGDGLYLRSRVAQSFRQPTIRELYLPFPTANPNLRPEYALDSDLGGGYLGEHLDVSVTGYRTQAKDLIKYFGAWPTAEVVNIDQVVIWGIEGRVALRSLGPFGLSVTGDWQDVGRFTRQNPDAKLDFTLDVGQQVGPHFLAGSVSGEWVHGLYMADYRRQPIADVFVLDATLRYRQTSVERGVLLEPYLILRNILNLRYAYVADYPMPGFNVLAGLKVGI
jgi:outer membrane cobalamin receptor